MGFTINQDLQSSHHIVTLISKSKENTETIIDHLPDLFWVIDSDGNLYKMNKVAESYLHPSKDSVRHQGDLRSLFSETQLTLFLERIQKEEEFEFSLRMDSTRADGPEEKVFLWSSRRLRVGLGTKRALFCVLGRDISGSVTLAKKNAQLEYQRQRIQAVFDAALQGFLTVGKNYAVQPGFSGRVAEFLEGEPGIAGRNVCEVLNLDSNGVEPLIDLIFKRMDWGVIGPLCSMETHVQDRALKVEFLPVLENEEVDRILVTLTDITQIKELQRRADESALEGRMIFKVLQAKEMFADILKKIEEFEGLGIDEDSARRFVHTLKGEFSYFEVLQFNEICERWEEENREHYSEEGFLEAVNELKEQVRVFLVKYNPVLNLIDQDYSRVSSSVPAFNEFLQVLQRNPKPEDLRDSVEKMFERPFSECLGWLDTAWKMAAVKLGKSVDPIFWKPSVSIFPNPYQGLFSTLIHAVRNAADHGIEDPETRVSIGKPEAGRLIAELTLQTGVYHLRLRDDGKGVSEEQIKERASKVGLQIPSTSEAVVNLLFEPGFSTRENVTAMSGRGIGLDAIRFEAVQLEGGAELIHFPHEGLELHVWFKKQPLTRIPL